MKITLLGAGGEVTGSAYLVETNQAKVLVDFGFFQGVKMAETRNRVPRALPVRSLNAVLLTHAHLDHTGRLPLLVLEGLEAPIYATPATRDFTGLILRDSAKIQSHDTERLNRKRQRAGKSPVEPLFDAADVEGVLQRIKEVPYQEAVNVAPGIEARFIEAGHILGSSSIQLRIQDEGTAKTIVFSGDLGPNGVPILKDYETFRSADVVFLETTYGDHDHQPFESTVREFEGIVGKAVANGGKILVPTFAVGRAQVLLYCLGSLFRSKALPSFPVFLDSPMAIEATEIYRRHPELFDEEANAIRAMGKACCKPDTLQYSSTANDSRALNDQAGPCMILAGAGMCNAGRILHHLKQNLWRPETWVLIVGYQGHGSLGRQLVDGKESVRIFGETIAVEASVRTLGGFSAHAGQADLVKWFDPMAAARPRVILTHGEERGREAMANLLKDRYQLQAERPMTGDTLEC